MLEGSEARETCPVCYLTQVATLSTTAKTCHPEGAGGRVAPHAFAGRIETQATEGSRTTVSENFLVASMLLPEELTSKWTR
jgi:hypothetical protein